VNLFFLPYDHNLVWYVFLFPKMRETQKLEKVKTKKEISVLDIMEN